MHACQLSTHLLEAWAHNYTTVHKFRQMYSIVTCIYTVLAYMVNTSPFILYICTGNHKLNEDTQHYTSETSIMGKRWEYTVKHQLVQGCCTIRLITSFSLVATLIAILELYSLELQPKNINNLWQNAISWCVCVQEAKGAHAPRPL